MHPTVQTLLLSGAQLTDAALERLLPSPDTLPHSIHRAMRHSTFAGGKRLRPILCMEAARMVAGTGEIPEGAAVELLTSDLPPLPKGVEHLAAALEMLNSDLPPLPKGVENLAAALEMLHTYSLIHDDLPALDNDDLRRGHPTCHVVFGEAIAILAGDALQTLAFQTISALPTPPATTVAILREISLAVGTGVGANSPLPPGMIGGQVVDIESEGTPPTAELVEAIHRAKTGALITTSIVSGGLYGLAHTPGAPHLDSEMWVHRLRTFGEKAGLAFQIVDDVLDMTQSSEELGKTAGKDTASIKATWPAVYGIDQSLKDAEQLIADAFEALTPFGEAATPLKSLANYLVERKH
ncbi:MAG: Geranyltranstransferase [Edaphobacter sp.]|nr:Geranyltranstransferase [Edaphobacter sp.]